jgi:hypothetical protein
MAGTLNYALPGLDVSIDRETIYPVAVDTAESAFEVRTRWSNTPKYRFKFKITARTNVAGTNEVAGLQAFYESNSGEWDVFSMTDTVPLANGTFPVRNCRFSGPLKMKRVMPSSRNGAWWEVTFEVTTVSDPT